MNLYLILTITLFVIFAISLIFRKRQVSIATQQETANIALDELVVSTISHCKDIIYTSLDSIVKNDTIDACKNLRQGADILYSLRKKISQHIKNNNQEKEYITIYLDYMLETTDHIAETSRNIVASPNFSTTIANKCEIMTIRDSVADMLTALNNTNELTPTITKASNQKDFLDHIISEHAKEMSHDDFNDDTYAYTHLMLLYYINAFIGSLHRILRHYSPHPTPSCQ